MNNKTLAIIGTQWGDEGKGKITDVYSQQADMVVRYQGGNNAGHTIIFDGKKYALNLLPSGIFNAKTKNVLASGMVINLEKLLDEIDNISKQGFDVTNLYISDRAHVIFPYHVKMDGLFEDLKAPENKIGTTKKGIGPAYSDKAMRDGIRISELLDYDRFKQRLQDNIVIKNKIFSAFGLELEDFEDIFEKYYELGQKIKDKVVNTSILVDNAIKNGERVLFEGAQGIMLDLDHGTYPFVTSSSPTSSSIPYNVGISPKLIENSLGIVKAYSTRVGGGVFPSELSNEEIANKIRIKGNEFGTVSKRPRRVGWFDVPLLKHSIRTSGINYLAITLLDVLEVVDEIEIVTHYELNGEVIDYIPANVNEYEKVAPKTIKMKGWNSDISNVSSFEELPMEAKEYLNKIESLLDVKIALFSVGPDRKQTIIIEEIF